MLKKISRIFITAVLALGIVFSNGPFWIVSSLLDSYASSQNIVDKAWHLSRDTNVVDSFNSLRQVADKIRIQEAHAAITYQSASAVANVQRERHSRPLLRRCLLVVGSDLR